MHMNTNKLRKSIGYIAAWILYYLGDWVSKPMYKWDMFAWLYPLYNNLMYWSISVQDWADDPDGPWSSIEK